MTLPAEEEFCAICDNIVSQCTCEDLIEDCEHWEVVDDFCVDCGAEV